MLSLNGSKFALKNIPNIITGIKNKVKKPYILYTATKEHNNEKYILKYTAIDRYLKTL